MIGGRVYRGSVAELQGKYVFGDWLGQIWAMSLNPDGDPPAAFDGTNYADFQNLTAVLAPPEGFGRLQGFGEDDAGELYILENCDPSELTGNVCPAGAVDGAVYKIVSPAEVPSLSTPAALAVVAMLAALGAVVARRR